MRLRTTAILATTALGLTVAGSASAAELPIAPIGTGKKTCVLGPGADCRGVVHPWGVEHHGNLRKAKFTNADLRGADFRGADLRRADFRGAKLGYLDLRDANLSGARFDVAPSNGKRANGMNPPSTACLPACNGAYLARAELQGANVTGANFSGAILWQADLGGAEAYGANFSWANLGAAYLAGTDFTNANLNNATFSGAYWNNTTCPNGSVTSTGC